MENANIPLAPGDDRHHADADLEQPVLQHPLGEDQQNLLAKPAQFKEESKRAGADLNDVDNFGHLPVNVRDNADDDDNNGGDKNEVKAADKSRNKRKSFAPVPKVDEEDKAKEVPEKSKRDKVQAGGVGRVLKEPKEYLGGVGKLL